MSRSSSSNNGAAAPVKGAEVDDFTGGDDQSTVLGFALAAGSDTIALSGGARRRAADAASNKAPTAMAATEVVSDKRVRVFTSDLFHRAFHSLDPSTRLAKRMEDCCATIVLQQLQRIAGCACLNKKVDIYLVNGVMCNVFNSDMGAARHWSAEEKRMLLSITNDHKRLLVHPVFLAAVTKGRKVHRRRLSQTDVALPHQLLLMFKPNLFRDNLYVTGDLFFKTLMILFVVRFTRRVHAHLQLQASNTVSEALLKSISFDNLLIDPVPRPLREQVEELAARKRKGAKPAAKPVAKRKAKRKATTTKKKRKKVVVLSTTKRSKRARLR